MHPSLQHATFMDKDIDINRHLLSSKDKCKQLGLTTERPKFPTYVLPSKREDSFKTWPENLPPLKTDLIEAGLVYTGVGDSVRCYHCGGGLRNWEAGDKPMLEHAKWYPECPHVLLVKGKDYIDAAGRGEDLDVTMATRAGPSTGRGKTVNRPNIRCVAAQSCTEMGYSIPDVERAMDQFISEQGNNDFKARDLLELILDQTEPEVAGACNVVDSQNEAGDVQNTEDEEEEDEDEIKRMYEENQRIKERQTCKICLVDPASIIFLPCGHLVACPQCAPALLKCPVCRLEVKGQVKAHYA